MFCSLLFPLCIGYQGQLLEAKKQLETQNTLQQKTRELLRTSEQQVAALKAQLSSASSSEAASSTPVTRTASLRAPLRGINVCFLHVILYVFFCFCNGLSHL